MAEAAAHLVDYVIPKVPVRQWVLSFPIPLRSLFAVHPELLAPALQIIHRAIATFLFKQTDQKRDQAATGAVTLIQRFGSAANLNIHLHALVLDGVYGHPQVASDTGAPGERPPAAPIFHPAPAPAHAALQALLGKIITRVLRLLTRLGHLIEEEGETCLAASFGDPDDLMTPLQAAAANYRIAHGPRAGQKVLSLQLAPRRPRGDQTHPALCANAHGPSTSSGQGSACTRACAARPRTGKGWSNCAVTSPARPLLTSA
jgi:Putative transposase